MNDMFRSPIQKKELRPHQVRAMGLLRQSLARGNRRVVLQGPVGFGKTLVAARIVEGALSKGKKVIFTAPAVSLIEQTVSAFEAEGLTGLGVMQSKHVRTDPLAQAQVASVQTLARREIPDAALMIVDECHLQFDVINRLMGERPDVFFIGLSATPWARGMGHRWQDLIVPITMAELIEQGFLSRYTAFAPHVPDLSGVKVRAGEYAEDALADYMGDAKLVGNVVETWLEHGENRPTLAFAVNRAHAAYMAGAFERAGIATAYVDGYTDPVEREVISKRFKRGDVRVICSVRTMIAGVDLPVSCIIDAAPTMSEMLHVQKLGRGMRVNPGTEDLKILDHAGNLLRLGMPEDILHPRLDATPKGERQERNAGAERLPKPCSQCATLHTGATCPACGHQRGQAYADVETREGELRQIGGKVKVPTKEEKQAWWSGLQTIRFARKRSKGWASNTYREKFGVWPKGLSDFPGNATEEMWRYVKAKDIRYAKRLEKQGGR